MTHQPPGPLASPDPAFPDVPGPAGIDRSVFDPEFVDAFAGEVAARVADQLAAAPRALLDLAGAAARLNVSQRTVESLVAVGELRVVRIGLGRGVRRFDPATLDAFIRRNTRSL